MVTFLAGLAAIRDVLVDHKAAVGAAAYALLIGLALFFSSSKLDKSLIASVAVTSLVVGRKYLP